MHVVNEKLVARYNPRRDNKSLNRSGVSRLRIRKTRMLFVVDRRPVNSGVGQTLDAKTELTIIERGKPWNRKEWYL